MSSSSYHSRVLNHKSWNRPICRMYSYNYQVGENYYHPMTQYLEARNAAGYVQGAVQTPGAMSFSERLAHRWIKGRTDFSSLSGDIVSYPGRVENTFHYATTTFF